MRQTFLLTRNVVILTGIILLLSSFPSPASADIYRWEDDGGVVHFTDDPTGIPPKYRGQSKPILKGPPSGGKPSVSTIGPTAPARGAGSEPLPAANGGISNPPSVPQESQAAEAEQLRAKIAAKERFVRGVDEKQSLATNPYRNRYVSPEDLELYRKYREELPLDREQLRELETRPSNSVR